MVCSKFWGVPLSGHWTITGQYGMQELQKKIETLPWFDFYAKLWECLYPSDKFSKTTRNLFHVYM